MASRTVSLNYDDHVEVIKLPLWTPPKTAVNPSAGIWRFWNPGFDEVNMLPRHLSDHSFQEYKLTDGFF
jgi:hypothetical protein